MKKAYKKIFLFVFSSLSICCFSSNQIFADPFQKQITVISSLKEYCQKDIEICMNDTKKKALLEAERLSHEKALSMVKEILSEKRRNREPFDEKWLSSQTRVVRKNFTVEFEDWTEENEYVIKLKVFFSILPAPKLKKILSRIYIDLGFRKGDKVIAKEGQETFCEGGHPPGDVVGEVLDQDLVNGRVKVQFPDRKYLFCPDEIEKVE